MAEYTSENFERELVHWRINTGHRGSAIVAAALRIAAAAAKPGVIEGAVGSPSWREFPIDDDERREVAAAIRAALLKGATNG